MTAYVAPKSWIHHTALAVPSQKVSNPFLVSIQQRTVKCYTDWPVSMRAYCFTLILWRFGMKSLICILRRVCIQTPTLSAPGCVMCSTDVGKRIRISWTLQTYLSDWSTVVLFAKLLTLRHRAAWPKVSRNDRGHCIATVLIYYGGCRC